jgi:hypothetical protein
MYLQASPIGAKLYKKFGFEVVSVEELDLSQYGIDKVDTRTYMKRVTRRLHQQSAVANPHQPGLQSPFQQF